MKNVMLYFKMPDTPYDAHTSIMDYLYAQIDNSLHFNWDPSDLIVISNFDFEYKGVTNTILKTPCNYNVWANKFYAIKQLFDDSVIDDFWLHDYDVWQIDHFDFPKFPGMMAGCPYDSDHPNWNGGSFFFSKDSYPLIEYICNFYEMNEDVISKYDDGRGPKWYSDELIIDYLRKQTDVHHLFSSLTPQFNLGMTFFNTRYEFAIKPIKAIHAKLLDVSCNNKFHDVAGNLDLIPEYLLSIITLYIK